MALLSKQEIVDVADVRYEEVDVPEWATDGNPDPSVRIRSLTGSERDRYEGSLMKIKDGQPQMDMTNSRARLCALSMVDEKGARLFSDNEVLKLGTKNARALERVHHAASKLSGIDNEELESAKETFDSGQSESSTSA